MDAITGSYAFPCPRGGTVDVRLSEFRVIERVHGTAHPAVYQVRFHCRCGDDHGWIVSHDDLDLAPLGLRGAGTFLNLMTARLDDVGSELLELTTRRIERGEWPWSFFCSREEEPRAVTPSAFALLAPATRAARRRDPVAVAIRCPVCGFTSINLVSRGHIDVPFCHDHRVGVVQHPFPDHALRTIDALVAEVHGAQLDERTLRAA